MVKVDSGEEKMESFCSSELSAGGSEIRKISGVRAV